MFFQNRKDAGQRLAKCVQTLSIDDPLVLALPRGGVPVAFEVAESLHAPLDVLVVRKIGAPSYPELGIGAITENKYFWIDRKLVRNTGSDVSKISEIVARENAELERRVRVYRGGKPLPSVEGRNVIVVDDGLATGVTARVACHYLKKQGAKTVTLASPVCSPRTSEKLQTEVDHLLCLEEPEPFHSVGQFYRDFTQTEDEEVLSLLKKAREWLPKRTGKVNPGLKIETDPFRLAINRRVKKLKSARDLNPLIEQVAESKIVMLGESSHGTHEFYEWRREISLRLIQEHGFNFIAVEGDWPPSSKVNRYIRDWEGRNAEEALSGFTRWPTWMWANKDIAHLSDALRSYNHTLNEKNRIGFYGLDVYSLFESIDLVLERLEKIDPFLARRARMHYSCFDRHSRDEKAYARSLVEFPEGCQEEVNESLRELLRVRLEGVKAHEEEGLFDAIQNARIVADAERYYRTMMLADEDSWNVRDRHMLDTLEILLHRYGKNSKAIVWAHNTHIGDYRATDMVLDGQINIGGLAREKWGDDQVSLVGFGTYEGSVTASGSWGGPIQSMKLPQSPNGTLEAILHSIAKSEQMDSFYFSLKDGNKPVEALSKTIGHRAIGVVYRPEYERAGNYVPTSLSHRYDAFVYVDKTRALEPLAERVKRGRLPGAWPSGI